MTRAGKWKRPIFGQILQFSGGHSHLQILQLKSLQSKKAILVEKQPSPGFSFILALALFLNLPYYQPSAILFGLNLNFLMDFEIGFYSGFSVFWSLSLGLPSISSFFIEFAGHAMQFHQFAVKPKAINKEVFFNICESQLQKQNSLAPPCGSQTQACMTRFGPHIEFAV